jgi:PBP1b-binding outer membrane lipoprotein LpoB
MKVHFQNIKGETQMPKFKTISTYELISYACHEAQIKMLEKQALKDKGNRISATRFETYKAQSEALQAWLNENEKYYI